MGSKAKDLPWKEIVELRARYRRSVHLERDCSDCGWLAGYVVTPLARAVTERIVGAVRITEGNRAWSLTGPYGSGKSAFSLFLSHLMRSPEERSWRIAKELLAEADAKLARSIFGARAQHARRQSLLPVLATGQRQSIEESLVAALAAACHRFWPDRRGRPAILDRVDQMYRRLTKGGNVAPRKVVELFENVAKKVAASTKDGQGLLVVLDEAGKALEFVAREHGDIQILQELAEAANRSGDTPIVFLVVLHQAFDQYAEQLPKDRRNEWEKVQGRFVDIPFQEQADQIVRLISVAIRRKGDLPATVERAGHKLCRSVTSHLNIPTSQDRKALAALLSDCLPLHPVTAVLLGPLFRSPIAQNERSLFAFLGALEPGGFIDFLHQTKIDDPTEPFYQPARLYDYVANTFGTRIFGRRGHIWAQVQETLRRLPKEADELDVRLVKTIGILSALGESAGLRPSRKILQLAVSGITEVAQSQVDDALRRLQRTNLLVYRKYRDAFQLWEGSDLNIDECIDDALARIDRSRSQVERLTRVLKPRPIVARRHLFRTGTLRYFTVTYVDESILDDQRRLVEENKDADGTVAVVIPRSTADWDSVRRRFEQPLQQIALGGGQRPLLVALPDRAETIRELAHEVAAIEMVQVDTPQLREDATARRELAARLHEAESVLRDELARITTGSAACRWFFNGRELKIGGAHDLSLVVSEICDEVYSKAPTIRNELVNRRHVSSSAAAARRSLLEAMLERTDEEQLGFTGTPPAYAIYRSLLEEPQIHRKDTSGRWIFAYPDEKQNGTLHHVWNALDQELERAPGARLPLEMLYEKLTSPPYGVREGVLPILVVAYLLSIGDEAAVYEDGAFVPRLTTPVAERLTRAPQKFAIQRFRITGARALVSERLISALMGNGRRPVTPLALVRSLVRQVAGLPAYSRHTRSISATAQAVREALLRAREPGKLLFVDLPAACGLEPFDESQAPNEQRAADFVTALKDSLRELARAYPRLLSRIQQTLACSFDLRTDDPSLRTLLRERADFVRTAATEPQLRSFIDRLRDEALGSTEWIISIGTLLAGKPPESWLDQDFDVMNTRLRLLTLNFKAVEALELSRQGDYSEHAPVIVRLSVIEPNEPERAGVFTASAADRTSFEALCGRLRKDLQAAAADLGRSSTLAAVAVVAGELIRDLQREESAQPTEREDGR